MRHDLLLQLEEDVQLPKLDLKENDKNDEKGFFRVIETAKF